MEVNHQLDQNSGFPPSPIMSPLADNISVLSYTSSTLTKSLVFDAECLCSSLLNDCTNRDTIAKSITEQIKKSIEYKKKDWRSKIYFSMFQRLPVGSSLISKGDTGSWNILKYVVLRNSNE